MFNIFAVKKNAKFLYVNLRVATLISGIVACSKYDERAKAAIANMPEGTEMCASILQQKNLIICKKENGALKCSIKKDFNVEDRAYILFKSLDLAIPVVRNKISFSKAFNQSRVILKGDAQLGMQLVKVFDIAQSCLATHFRRKNLSVKPLSAKEAIKIKIVSFFRGWR